MKCPKCKSERLKLINKSGANSDHDVKRTYECKECHNIFYSYERPQNYLEYKQKLLEEELYKEAMYY